MEVTCGGADQQGAADGPPSPPYAQARAVGADDPAATRADEAADPVLSRNFLWNFFTVFKQHPTASEMRFQSFSQVLVSIVGTLVTNAHTF